MPWFRTGNSPPSSKSLGSPNSPSRKILNLRDLNFFRSKRESQAQPRLTRQRKLRHLGDVDVGGSGAKNGPRSSVSATPTPLSRSPSNREGSTGRSSAVVPLPLPPPELSAFMRTDSGSGTAYNCPLPSPKEDSAQSSNRVEGEGNGIEFSSGEGIVERIVSTSVVVSKSVTGSPLDNGRRRDPIVTENIQSFSLSAPVHSAPTSGFSSPVRSPRRMSSGDFFPSALMASQGLQVRSSAQEFPADVMFFNQNLAEMFGASPDHSSLYSPVRSPHPLSANPSASPLHPKISQESSAWHDNNGNVTVHPLPLPPGAAVPQQAAFVHQPAVKVETSFMVSQWKKGKLIGRGTFGNVYVATNRETGALCAMKEVSLIPDDPKSAECMKQLEQEIKVLSQLKHPNIVQYYGSEIVNDRFYICLEHVYPGSISKYIREHCGAVTESVVRNFTRHILSGLAYLHSTKTMHRDIKGANLLVDATGVVKLADFGMAKHLSGQAAELSLKGSPYWMAPEVMQAMMNKDSVNDLAVDIWSLGCTIIEMFTGKPPWSEFEGPAAMFKVLNASPPIPETLSAEGKDFLQCCFRRKPEQRPVASLLLEHRFVRNSHSQEIPGCMNAFSRMKVADVAQSPKERPNLFQMHAHLAPQAIKGQQSSNGETAQSHPETSKSTAARRHSPRSTLEFIPSLSPPSSHCSSHNSGPGNIRYYNLSRTHGREATLLI